MSFEFVTSIRTRFRFRDAATAGKTFERIGEGTGMTKARDVQLNGIVPIIPTPFTREEQVDWCSLRILVDFACATGACAVCLPAYAS